MQGSARGAFALGQTYDPDFLKRMNVVGMQPDFKTAKKWYEKAAQMGNTAAVRRLNSMEKEGR
jgi:TPR repeat protein